MAQKEYLKMADVFTGGVIVRFSTELRDGCGFICDAEDDDQAKYISHAINTHDELVAEVERLRSHLSQVKWLCEHFANCGGWDINAYSEYVNANIEPIWSQPEEVE